MKLNQRHDVIDRTLTHLHKVKNKMTKRIYLFLFKSIMQLEPDADLDEKHVFTQANLLAQLDSFPLSQGTWKAQPSLSPESESHPRDSKGLAHRSPAAARPHVYTESWKPSLKTPNDQKPHLKQKAAEVSRKNKPPEQRRASEKRPGGASGGFRAGGFLFCRVVFSYSFHPRGWVHRFATSKHRWPPFHKHRWVS